MVSSVNIFGNSVRWNRFGSNKVRGRSSEDLHEGKQGSPISPKLDIYERRNSPASVKNIKGFSSCICMSKKDFVIIRVIEEIKTSSCQARFQDNQVHSSVVGHKNQERHTQA